MFLHIMCSGSEASTVLLGPLVKKTCSGGSGELQDDHGH